MVIVFATQHASVVVPATSANLGPGYDALGLALDLTDEVSVEITDGGTTVAVIGEGADEVSTDESHLIVAAMHETFADLGVRPPAGVALTCHNRIPHARGLGSSSAAIIAGILLARALVGVAGDHGILRLAARLEGHPDNVAPCLLGGFTIAWIGAQGAEAVRLEVAPDVRPVLYIPTARGLTSHARAALPATVPHADAAFNAARAALLVHALTAEPARLLEATDDRLHQPYRAPGLPETAALVAALRAQGVPAVVSGAGPSVLAFANGRDSAFVPRGGTADRIQAAGDAPKGWIARPLAVSLAGARILGTGHAEGDPVAAGLPS